MTKIKCTEPGGLILVLPGAGNKLCNLDDVVELDDAVAAELAARGNWSLVEAKAAKATSSKAE